MQYAQLGKTDLNISRIGFGCMSLHADNKENEKVLLQAVESGITYFDTADLYDKGENEKLVGTALKGKRKDLIIATKVGNQWRAGGSGWHWNPKKKYILSAVEESLKRLQTDYVDLYQLHGGTIEDDFDEVIEAFEYLQQQGKILHYGISSIRPNVIRKYTEQSNISSVMMQYSLLDRRPEETCLPLLQQKNISVLARGSVAQGLLVNKSAKAYLNFSESEVAAAAQAVNSVSNSNRNAAQTALQFVLTNPAVTAAVVGIRTVQQLQEAVNALDTPMLTQQEVNILKNVLPANLYTDHR